MLCSTHAKEGIERGHFERGFYFIFSFAEGGGVTFQGMPVLQSVYEVYRVYIKVKEGKRARGGAFVVLDQITCDSLRPKKAEDERHQEGVNSLEHKRTKQRSNEVFF